MHKHLMAEDWMPVEIVNSTKLKNSKEAVLK